MTAATARISIIGDRAPIFWGACAAIAIGVLLHLPMLAMAHSMGNHLYGMPMDTEMWFGMALIILGVPAAIYGALPKHRAPHGSHAGTSFEAPDSTPLNRWHAVVLAVLILGLLSLIALGIVHLERPRAQLAALVVFAVAIAATLGLVAARERPFAGAERISPAALEDVLSTVSVGDVR